MPHITVLPNPLPADYPHGVSVNCTTGETITAPYTVAEYNQREDDQALHAIERAEQEAEATAKAEAKARGDAKLLALGLTAEEIAAR
jgi:hypothetical protein